MTTVSEAVDEFLLACRADGLSPATVKWYRSILAALVAAHGGQGLETVTTHEMRRYVVSLQDRGSRYVDAPQKPQQDGGLSRDSIASHVTGLQRFWSWAADEYSTDNPMRTIRRPKRPPRQPKAISSADFVRLFNATEEGTTAGARDRALLAFLADTGIRLGGAVSLTLEGLQLEAGRAVVEEKGLSKRVVVFTAITRRLLEQWLGVRRADSDAVFVSMQTGEALTEGGVYQVLKRLKQRAGVRGRVNPHAFRHGFAREYALNGGDIVTLARLMGHKDVNVTADYYAVFSSDELAELHARYSPMRAYTLAGGEAEVSEE